jgi:hypothetical protein
MQFPIIQALAPYHPAGCRAVNELVSRALFDNKQPLVKK